MKLSYVVLVLFTLVYFSPSAQADSAQIYCECDLATDCSSGDVHHCTCPGDAALSGDTVISLGGLASMGIQAHCSGQLSCTGSGDTDGIFMLYESRDFDAPNGVDCDGKTKGLLDVSIGNFSCTNWDPFDTHTVTITKVYCLSRNENSSIGTP
jgi:hypothetical protein